MPKVAVITTVYNACSVMKKCLDALINNSSKNVHIVLVDNHSPDEDTRKTCAFYAQMCAVGNANGSGECLGMTVLDPGKNIGTHNGWNHGFTHGVKDKGFNYVVKLDDDTIIQTPKWDQLMVEGLESRPDIAFLSADGTREAKQLDTWDVQQKDKYIYEIPPRNIVDFHCVMFRVDEMLRWGNQATGVYLTNPEGDGDKRLYGGEELYMARKVRAEGRKIAYFRNVFCDHLDSKDRCQDYQLWKYVYGVCRWTDKAVDEWRSSGEMLRDMRKLLGQWALKNEGWGKQYIAECVRRIGDIGEVRDAGALLLIARGNPTGLGNYKPRDDMPEIIEECERSSVRITERLGKR
jgi:glycosyltransferase involved in cell wall biosynthesis